MTKLFSLFIILSFVLPVSGQEKLDSDKARKEKAYHLTGSVREQGERPYPDPLPDVNIQLYSLPDTSFIEGTVSDKKGVFRLYPMNPGNYLIRASFLGYETIEKKVNIPAYRKEVYGGALMMKPSSIVLDETVIKAELQKMKMSGDTLVYNTGAFKTSEGAVLQDLVRQLPGLELDEKSGKMNFHGKEITQILLNGKEFFADSKVALNNMPVDALKEVKVYEQQSDKEQMTGVSDGKKKTVMDVKTKKDLTDGLMGDVSALKGSGDMYGAKMSLNKFVGKWRMSLYGDLGKLPRYGNFISDMADNPAQMKDIGFSLGTEIKKLNLNVSASYNNNKSADESRSQSEEYLPNGSQYAYNNGLSTGRNRSFWENIYLTGSLSDRTEINFRHNINHSRLNSVSENISATFSTNPLDYVSEPWRDDAMIPPEFRINKNTGNSQNKTNNLMIGNNLLLTHKLNDIGRKLSIELRNDYSNQASGNYQQSSITYYQLKNDLGADSVLYRNQYRESPARNLLLAGEVSYTEPIGKQMLQVYYRHEYQRQSNNAVTYNLDEDALWGSLPSGYEAGRVDSLSDYTRNDLHSNEFGLRTTLNWRKVRLNIRFGLSPQKSTTKSNRGKVKIDTTITVLNIVPELHFDYDLGNNHNMSVYYSGYTRQPSIYDLLSVPDYTNPLNITMGNPGLKPAFGQSISVNYRGGNMEKQEMLYCGLRYNNTINDISRKRTYDEKSGVYTSRPENINGNWGIGGNIYYYTNKLFKKIFARLATNANYNRRVSYVQIMGEANENDRNTSQMLSLMQDVEFAYKLEEHEFKINGAITYQQADNSYTNNSDYRTYDFYYGAECRLKLPLNLNLYTVVRSMNRRGYKDEASNTTQWLWNGELTYSFLKGKRGLLKFQVVDILQQRDFVNRWMNDTGQGETWTWGLGRYAMATFTYRFNDLSR